MNRQRERGGAGPGHAQPRQAHASSASSSARGRCASSRWMTSASTGRSTSPDPATRNRHSPRRPRSAAQPVSRPSRTTAASRSTRSAAGRARCRRAGWATGDRRGPAPRLLTEVARRTPDDRRARYVCVAALARPDAEPVTAHGECLGTLVSPPRGTNGFGYDPAFLSADLGITFGEAPEEAKARVSHRARAIARLGDAGVFELGAVRLTLSRRGSPRRSPLPRCPRAAIR